MIKGLLKSSKHFTWDQRYCKLYIQIISSLSAGMVFPELQQFNMMVPYHSPVLWSWCKASGHGWQRQGRKWYTGDWHPHSDNQKYTVRYYLVHLGDSPDSWIYSDTLSQIHLDRVRNTLKLYRQSKIR